MIRKTLLLAAAVAMPLGLLAATAGTASASSSVSDPTGAPATASCTLSGGTFTFKYAIGIGGSGYVPPAKNKGNQIKVAGITLTCTSSAVSGSFTGVAAGKIKTTNPGDTPAEEYSCTSLVGVSPGPGGTLTGVLKVKWAAPAGQKFAGGKKTDVVLNSVLGGVNGSGDGTFTIPGNPGTGSISGSFPGSDAGASSTTTDATAQTEGTLAGECTSSSGLSTIPLGSGTASLQ